ncbi:hypothetical protein [Paenibacillus campi]|uniref:hypothetical protein n=1 Tax=Paenibacillus campi TaxID=3106031 RepID=UPI002AFF83B4|nr:hypothetical protein [Paenibacillus sp. SGZ-1009]
MSSYSIENLNKNQHQIVDLSTHFNNDAISYASNLADGRFNVWWNTFPAEELPDSHTVIEIQGVPFLFPAKEDGEMNNLIAAEQIIDVQAGNYDWIYMLAAGERRAEDTVYLHYTNGEVDQEWIRISDFWPGESVFGELVGIRTQNMHYPNHIQRDHQPTIWLQRIPVTRINAQLNKISLPFNKSIHIFAMTMM